MWFLFALRAECEEHRQPAIWTKRREVHYAKVFEQVPIEGVTDDRQVDLGMSPKTTNQPVTL